MSAKKYKHLFDEVKARYADYQDSHAFAKELGITTRALRYIAETIGVKKNVRTPPRRKSMHSGHVEQVVIAHYHDTPTATLAKMLKIKPVQVRRIALRHGIRKSKEIKYTKAQRQAIRERYADEPTAEIAKDLGLSRTKVTMLACQMGLSKTKDAGIFTAAQREAVMNRYMGECGKALADELGLSGRQVRGLANYMGLKKQHRFTEDQLEAMRRRYPTTPSRVLAAELGLSMRQLYEIASRLKIRKAKIKHQKTKQTPSPQSLLRQQAKAKPKARPEKRLAAKPAIAPKPKPEARSAEFSLLLRKKQHNTKAISLVGQLGAVQNNKSA